MSRLKGIIFDFNGVLVLDSRFNEQSWQQLVLKKRERAISREEWAHLLGRTNHETIEYLLGTVVPPTELAELSREKELIYQRLFRAAGEGFRLSPGSEKLLEILKTREVPRAIATSSMKINIDFYWESFNLGKWFVYDNIVYFDGTFPGKPAPDLYQRAIQRLRLEPKEVIIVEDSKQGILSAQAAGAGFVIALAIPVMRDALHEIPGVDLVISSLAEVNPDELF